MSGRVQGVGYRAATAQAAGSYPDLRGWVRNLSSGQVEAVFAGEPAEVLAMVSWCKRGPAHAQVTDLEVQEETFDPGLSQFVIRRDPA